MEVSQDGYTPMGIDPNTWGLLKRSNKRKYIEHCAANMFGLFGDVKFADDLLKEQKKQEEVWMKYTTYI